MVKYFGIKFKPKSQYVYADGDTPEEAVDNLRDAEKRWGLEIDGPITIKETKDQTWKAVAHVYEKGE